MRRSSQRADMVCELSERSGATRSQPPSHIAAVIAVSKHIKCSQIYNMQYNTRVYAHTHSNYNTYFWSLQIHAHGSVCVCVLPPHTHTHTQSIGVSCLQHELAKVHLSNIRHMDWIIYGNLEIRTSLPQIQLTRHMKRNIVHI